MSRSDSSNGLHVPSAIVTVAWSESDATNTFASGVPLSSHNSDRSEGLAAIGGRNPKRKRSLPGRASQDKISRDGEQSRMPSTSRWMGSAQRLSQSPVLFEIDMRKFASTHQTETARFSLKIWTT